MLAHLLANGFRGKVNLIYIDPPFDSGADYVRKVSLRGAKGTAKLDSESYTLGEQIQYTDIWANDNYLQFMYERVMLLKELLAPGAAIYVHMDEAQEHYIKVLMDEVFGRVFPSPSHLGHHGSVRLQNASRKLDTRPRLNPLLREGRPSLLQQAEATSS